MSFTARKISVKVHPHSSLPESVAAPFLCPGSVFLWSAQSPLDPLASEGVKTPDDQSLDSSSTVLGAARPALDDPLVSVPVGVSVLQVLRDELHPDLGLLAGGCPDAHQDGGQERSPARHQLGCLTLLVLELGPLRHGAPVGASQQAGVQQLQPGLPLPEDQRDLGLALVFLLNLDVPGAPGQDGHLGEVGPGHPPDISGLD